MKKKGFTLIELIAIFSLIVLIATLTVPMVTKQLKQTTEHEYQRFLDDINLASESYIGSHLEEYPTLSVAGGTACIPISKLVEEGYLKSTMINPDTKESIDLNTSVQITFTEDQKLTYEWKQNSTC